METERKLLSGIADIDELVHAVCPDCGVTVDANVRTLCGIEEPGEQVEKLKEADVCIVCLALSRSHTCQG